PLHPAVAPPHPPTASPPHPPPIPNVHGIHRWRTTRRSSPYPPVQRQRRPKHPLRSAREHAAARERNQVCSPPPLLLAVFLSHPPSPRSFPGGGIDPHDTSPAAAARRETAEELGLPTAGIEVLGRLAPAEHSQ